MLLRLAPNSWAPSNLPASVSWVCTFISISHKGTQIMCLNLNIHNAKCPLKLEEFLNHWDKAQQWKHTLMQCTHACAHTHIQRRKNKLFSSAWPWLSYVAFLGLGFLITNMTELG
jgi:hypothetical protein